MVGTMAMHYSHKIAKTAIKSYRHKSANHGKRTARRPVTGTRSRWNHHPACIVEGIGEYEFAIVNL